MLSTSLFVLCINDVEENESGTQISKFVDDTNICGTVYKYELSKVTTGHRSTGKSGKGMADEM